MTQWRAEHCLLKQKGLHGSLCWVLCVFKRAGWHPWSSGSLSVLSESFLSGPVSRLAFQDTSMNQTRSNTSNVPQPEGTGWGLRNPSRNTEDLETHTAAAVQSHLRARPCVSFTAESRKPAISYYNIILYLFSKLFFMCHLFP